MTTASEYQQWLFQPDRDPYRRFLLEIGYSDDSTIEGHGRTNGGATLNPVQSLTVEAYSNNVIEVLFAQPVVQENYEWSIWLNGSEVDRTAGGSYRFTGIVGNTYQAAIASEKDTRYSIPFIVNFTYTGNRLTANGAASDWELIGAGKGGEATGLLRLSWPDAWISDEGEVYDNHITSDIKVARNIGDFNGIGAFRVANLVNEINWDTIHWRGHACQLYHGDKIWSREDYVLISENLTDGVRQYDGQEYQFDLMDAGQLYQGVFSTESIANSGTVEETLNKIVESEGLDNLGYNSLTEKKGFKTYYEIDNEQTIESIIRDFARSINADFARGLLGQGNGLRQIDDAIYYRFDESSIFMGTMITVSSTPSAKFVKMKLANDQGLEKSSIRITTDAKTSALRETVIIDSVLTEEDEAAIVLAEYGQYYSKTRYIRRMEVHYPNLVLVNGLLASITHPDFTGVGKIIAFELNFTQGTATLEIEDHDFVEVVTDFEPFIRVVD